MVSQDNISRHPRIIRMIRLVCLAVIALPTTASCQNTLGVGALNNCGRAVEADANSIDSADDVHWGQLEPGARGYLASVEEAAQRIYVRVRVNEAGDVVTFVVPVDSLRAPPDDSGYDVEVVLEGDRCPSE